MIFRLEPQIRSLFISLKKYDPYTASHCTSVARLSYLLAPLLGCSSEELFLAGLLHDIGKIYTPLSILQKPSRLTQSEYEVIKLHPVQGHDLLHRLTLSSLSMNVLDAVLFHHERLDGKGYPNNLSSINIPEYAKIISVVDAYDSMTSERPYRACMSSVDALAILFEGKGTQFDPKIVDQFHKIMTRLAVKS